MTEPVIRRAESTDELFAAAGRDYLLRSDAAPEESLAHQGVAFIAPTAASPSAARRRARGWSTG